ncbi:hypothetical protein D9757_007612 [Collybiopsis confluens]|uniref:GH16 domain-containing protein n=1 Tax=Collybiopsis confluens TaxID=2823264 RepID=A0A8H5M2X7_9AGAR|nr:hypothetical protein D9757_007612 [Collybiopsis confluens]
MPHRRAAIKHRSTNYKIEDSYQGQDFLDSSKWTYYSDSDPTHGLVNYLSAADAKSKGLAYVQDDGTTILAVDNYTTLSSGQPRNSVRVATTKSYNSGLFIASFWAMPHGCSLWPAYWSVGPNWPNNGEIDIIEGVNLNTVNQMTLHTSADCAIQSSLSNLVSINSTLGNLDCASSDSDNTGCAIMNTNPHSYGHGFNMLAGGVYAHEWTSNAIKIWFFSRNSIPSDITNKNPDPSSWGTPSAMFNNDACDIASHFSEHSLTLDITLCGDWAGGAFGSGGCSGSCQDTVADPSNFDTARWEIDYIDVYQSS